MMTHSKKTPALLAAGASFVTLLCAGALASGPYIPLNIRPPVFDLMYGLGKSIYVGEAKIGTGQTCVGCHKGPQALRKASLRTMKVGLEQQINTCATRDDRGRGRLDNSQMETLVHFIKKRYRL